MKRRIIEALEPTMAKWERRWIPIGEQRPRDGESVLAYDPQVPEVDAIAMLAFYASSYAGSGEWTCPCAREGDAAYDYNPTHWMPLPAPPAEKE